MRQVSGFLLRWTRAILNGRPIALAVLLSLSCSVVIADSNIEYLDNIDEAASLKQPEPVSKPSMPTHTVVVGDTLWNVTFRLRPEGMPMAQAMDVLYKNNPQAFLEGDSTKLIEGSVVSFASTEVVNKPADIVLSEENSTLIIPTIDAAEGSNIDLDTSLEVIKEAAEISPVDGVEDVIVGLDASPEVIQEATKVASEALVEVVEIIESSPEIIEPEPVLNQPTNQIDSTESPSNTVSFDRLMAQLKEFDKKDVSQVVAKVKQLPIDFWVFVGALLFAMVINRSRKLDQINKADKAEEDSSQGQKSIATVLDDHIAESADDDVFDEISETVADANIDTKKNQPTDELSLPGVEELEAQFREDAEGDKSQASQFLEVDFEDDTMDIDPLQIKLDMASLCIEMGDIESAQAILEEIIGEADKKGKAKARKILDSIDT
jgi:FimV-like protein